ncbi:MAG: CDP-archaeol synthase [Candidatus Micrarchaeota archaeon]|nr:CDP-archaeol synthase [Candidatus Micrarchaeota archaeon]
MQPSDALLLIPLYITNAALLPIMRFRLLGFLHQADRPVSEALFGKNRTWLGLILIILGVSGGYFLLFNRWCFFPAAGFAAGVHASSLVKRRLRMKESQPFPFLDQLDFFAGAAIGLGMCGWHFADLALAAVLTFLAHLSANIAAYRIGIKDTWW